MKTPPIKTPLRAFVLSLILLTIVLPVSAQVTATQQTIKFPVWVLVDGIPNLEEETDGEYGLLTLALTRMKQTVPLILEGLVYGWKFTYTPADKLRGVEEYFEFEPIEKIKIGDKNITFSEPEITPDRLTYWVSYARTDSMFALRKHWASVTYPKAHGVGQGLVSKGNDGLEDAYRDAVRMGVREYARSVTKNKPKEITGTVLVSDYPLVSVQSGKYVVKLKLLLDVTRIVPYTSF